MKKRLILVLAVAMILGVALAAFAQQDDSRRERMRQRWQQWRAAQQQAIATIQKSAAKLAASMEEAAKAMQNRSQWQDMSEEERNKLRETWRKQREEWQKTIADLELQITILKGQRQLRTEHEEAMEELKAIRDLASGQAAERLGMLIDKHQKKYEEMLKKTGLEQ